MDHGTILTDGETLAAGEAPSLCGQPNILPDSRLKTPKSPYAHLGMNWVKLYCANCGKQGPFVPEENCQFAFYLCQPCSETHGEIAGTYIEPDVVFWEKVRQAQLEKYGRELGIPEIEEALKDEHHILSKLARERKT